MAVATKVKPATPVPAPAETVTKAQAVKAQVRKSGGIAKVLLGDVRNELGHARLGKNVLVSISNHLAEAGLGFYPAWILDPEQNPEPRQYQEFHVYEKDGSPKATVLEAMGDPEAHDLGAVLDTFTGDAPTYKDMSDKQKLAAIRAIVA